MRGSERKKVKQLFDSYVNGYLKIQNYQISMPVFRILTNPIQFLIHMQKLSCCNENWVLDVGIHDFSYTNSNNHKIWCSKVNT